MANPGDELVFAPLGGVGEIGMNLSIYGFGPERRRTWLAVDLGVAFGSEELLPGIDLIMPDVRFLAEERQNLVGIVLTHAHEDHFGALIDLWPRLRVPVYATPFTAALFEAKRLGELGAPEIPINVVPLGARFSLGLFDIELVSVAHSIPESNALIIRTPLGTVLHTGDWKIDPTPVLGAPTDEAKLRALGQEGVLALIGDSTNAVREGRSPSEADVAKVLAELVRDAPARVAVTTFASNVARIRSAALAGFAAGREIVVIGRAMERVIQVARETGYLDGIGDFRGTDVYGYLPPDKVLALCTGSQGEPRAALARIALDEHPDVSLTKGDRVIFSSRTIPGNEKPVGRVVNGLVRQGVEVISDRTHLVHVSGHPRRAELADMFSWVKPRIAVPVHGEALHLAEHAALARSLGVPATIVCSDGDLIKLAPEPAGIIDEVPAARLYKDGRLLIEAAGRTVSLRRRLAYNGMVTVALALTEKGELVGDPEVELIGIPELDAAGESMTEIAYDAVKATLESLPRARRRDPDETAESIRRAVRSAIADRWGKKPVCHVHVLGGVSLSYTHTRRAPRKRGTQ
jgi:ribonuclease J